MVKIPLTLKLKKKMHADIAGAQDMIVKELNNSFDKAVLHGGTAIWRCYEGNRFSEDVDAYIPRDEKRIDGFFDSLNKKGFSIDKKKIGKISLFSKLELNRTIIRFEALFKKPLQGEILKEYETADGNMITVYTLTAEELIKEKIGAYLKRRKIRDIYDIFFLLRHVKNREVIYADLRRLTKYAERPIDEPELRVLIIEGLVPSYEKIIDYIKRW